MIVSNLLSKKEARMRTLAAILSLVVGIGILFLKFWAHNLTSSQAIYSDALESIVNVLTAAIGLLVVYYAAKPADEDHPYGHGKIEYFSATFEGGLVTFAAFFVLVEAIKSQLNHEPLKNLDMGMLIVSIAGILNLLLGFVLKKAGQKYASLALEASGTHVIIDFWTTVGAVTGVLLVRFTGMKWIDTTVAIMLGLYMGASGLRLVKQSVSGLLDAEDMVILEKLAQIFEKFAGEGIIQIHHTKVIRSGWYHHIDAHVVVPEFWTIDEAHARLDVFENQVIRTYEYGGEANFHLDPCRRNYCAVCDYKDCPVRKEQFKQRMPVAIEHLRSKTEPREFRS